MDKLVIELQFPDSTEYFRLATEQAIHLKHWCIHALKSTRFFFQKNSTIPKYFNMKQQTINLKESASY